MTQTNAPDAAPGDDRRRDVRHDVDLPARLSLVGLTVDGRLSNVAARGVCFVTSDQQVRVAESNFVRVEFTLPDGDAPKTVQRFVRITRIERSRDPSGAEVRRIGLAWDEPLPSLGTA